MLSIRLSVLFLCVASPAAQDVPFPLFLQDAGRRPTLEPYASVSRGVCSMAYGALFEPNPLEQRVSFGFSMSAPLLQRGEAFAQIAYARAVELNVEADVRAVSLMVERSVRSVYTDVNSAYRSARVPDQACDLARRRLKLATDQFRLASLKFVELQSVVADAAHAERDPVEARCRFARPLTLLEEETEARVLTPLQS